MPPTGRLDSWKAIADYMRRDVRTLQRWEKEGLPIRRVGVGRGASVFAFTSEIDDWLQTRATAPVEAPPVPVTPRRFGPVGAGLAVCAVIAAGVLAWGAWAAPASGVTTVVETTRGVVARDAQGRERWRFDFPDGEVASLPRVPPVVALGRGDADVLALVAARARTSDHAALGGVVRAFGARGQLVHEIELTDRHVFGGRAFAAPWDVDDVAVGPGADRRVAVVAHHDIWWPAVLTVFDARWQRGGTFVNSGWVAGVRWLSPVRLAIAGFNQARDGGMVAVLDADHLDGASPEAPGSEFACDDCGTGRPVFYAVFPRSEVNRATGSRFNVAVFDARRDGVYVHTAEAERETENGPVSEALYEFTPDMTLRTATYGADYWARHRALELRGVLHHNREACPERDGPSSIQIWTPATGWRVIATHPAP